jgi:hypothetical protein
LVVYSRGRSSESWRESFEYRWIFLASAAEGAEVVVGDGAGNTVAAGIPVIGVLDLDPVKVRVAIPEAEIGKVREGARAASLR